VTADTALRLARYFGTTPGFWMGIQTQYDLERAQDGLTGELERIAPEKQAATKLTDYPELRVEESRSSDKVTAGFLEPAPRGEAQSRATLRLLGASNPPASNRDENGSCPRVRLRKRQQS
jgi:hypothetical protein